MVEVNPAFCIEKLSLLKTTCSYSLKKNTGKKSISIQKLCADYYNAEKLEYIVTRFIVLRIYDTQKTV